MMAAQHEDQLIVSQTLHSRVSSIKRAADELEAKRAAGGDEDVHAAEDLGFRQPGTIDTDDCPSCDLQWMRQKTTTRCFLNQQGSS